MGGNTSFFLYSLETKWYISARGEKKKILSTEDFCSRTPTAKPEINSSFRLAPLLEVNPNSMMVL